MEINSRVCRRTRAGSVPMGPDGAPGPRLECPGEGGLAGGRLSQGHGRGAGCAARDGGGPGARPPHERRRRLRLRGPERTPSRGSRFARPGPGARPLQDLLRLRSGSVRQGADRSLSRPGDPQRGGQRKAKDRVAQWHRWKATPHRPDKQSRQDRVPRLAPVPPTRRGWAAKQSSVPGCARRASSGLRTSVSRVPPGAGRLRRLAPASSRLDRGLREPRPPKPAPPAVLANRTTWGPEPTRGVTGFALTRCAIARPHPWCTHLQATALPLSSRL